jgi:NAD(P)-dependent dehydrogenase (short-subunit alcohol dehydrogenase family)
MMLAEKTVMVTGVGSGLGRECVTSALREGANVVMAARTKETLEATATELDPSGARVEAVPTDITDADDCAALVARATERFGSLDALIQVAAFEYVFGGLQDTNLDDWRTAFETNVLGALTVLRPVARSMQESGGGAVVLIGSQSMFKPSLPQAGYAASKGALLSTMYYLADELGAHNIRCNMVVPSWMWGPPVQMYVEGTAKHKDVPVEEVLHDLVGDFPLGRMTEDGEVADVAIFFASDHAKAVTGQHLMVNAGEMMR